MRNLFFLLALLCSAAAQAQRPSLQEAFGEPIFVDTEGKTRSLRQIVDDQTSQGRIVYADFWASWCAPCRKAMPASRQLAQKLQNLPITFLFLAVEDNQEVWLAAIKELKINDLKQEHYRANKADIQKIFAALAFYTIPHYTIFDKKGRPIEPKALGPQDKRVEKQLRKLAN